METLLPWQNRVIEERLELEKKLESLQDFIDSDAYGSLQTINNYT